MGGIGGGGKGGGAPSAPDFTALANQQSQLSQQNVNQQTAANRPDQTNVFGATSNWTQNPDGTWSQQSSLNGALGQGAQNLMGQIGAQGALGNGDAARDQAITSAYQQAMSRLNPEWNQRQSALNAQLANQGLSIGDEAYQTAQGDFGRNRNDAETSAMASAIQQGTAAGNSVFQNNLAAQMAPYQQLQMLQGLGKQDSFNMAGQAQTPDLLGAGQQQYQAALNQYGQQQAGKNSTMSGLGSLAGMAGGFMLGGPAGAMVGSSLGGMAGNALGGG